MSILEEIIANKKKEIESRRAIIPFEELINKDKKRKTISMVNALSVKGSSGIIAEFKTMSPSKGIISREADVETVTLKYVNAGVAGLSVLTDTKYFGGSFDNLKRTRAINNCPVLQKDFIIDEYQIAEAYLNGADVVLLIAAALDRERAGRLAGFAKEYEMEVILEIHSGNEIDMLSKDVDIVGVNNRDLKTFETNVNNSLSLIKDIPAGFLKISESGIYDALTIMRLKEAGFSGFLIGEHFMKEHDPGEACGKLIKQLNKAEKTQ